jgi:hypothetical protein
VVRQSPAAAKYARGSATKTDITLNITTTAPDQARTIVQPGPSTGGSVIHLSQKASTGSSCSSYYDLGHRSKPVVYFKKKAMHWYRTAGYGVQIAYYKDLSQCRRDLEKYRAYFKIAGFVAEDYNLDDYRFRLILGRYTYVGAAGRLLVRLQHYFPFCFIVKYA